jgi:TruB family pseudouridylate synthase (N terminal domain)
MLFATTTHLLLMTKRTIHALHPSLALPTAAALTRSVVLPQQRGRTKIRSVASSSSSAAESPPDATGEDHHPQPQEQQQQHQVPLLLRAEGILALYKPLTWTSSDVVVHVRGMLERDARARGADPVRATSRKSKSRIVRVGHGGTLDPLATGVLVMGIGRGTKELQRYGRGRCGRCFYMYAYAVDRNAEPS